MGHFISAFVNYVFYLKAHKETSRNWCSEKPRDLARITGLRFHSLASLPVAVVVNIALYCLSLKLLRQCLLPLGSRKQQGQNLESWPILWGLLRGQSLEQKVVILRQG